MVEKDVGFVINSKDLEKFYNQEFLDKVDRLEFEEILENYGFEDKFFGDNIEIYNLKDGYKKSYKNETVLILYLEKVGLYTKYESLEEIYNEILNKLNNMEFEGIKIFKNIDIKDIENNIGNFEIEIWNKKLKA